MTYLMTLQKLAPWRERNDWEGQVEGEINGYSLCCYTQLMNMDELSDSYKPGDQLDVDVWLERSAEIAVMDDCDTHLSQLSDVLYELTGTVKKISGEIVQLDSVFPLRVELSSDPNIVDSIPDINVDDKVKVVGVMRLDIDRE